MQKFAINFNDEDIRKIHNRAGMVTPDGMPLVWLGQFNNHKNVDRVYGPDLMHELCEKSITKGYQHFLYGGNVSVPDLIQSKLEEKFPGINIVGNYSPPFRALSGEEDDKIIETIKGQTMAGGASPLPCSLHADLFLMVKSS